MRSFVVALVLVLGAHTLHAQEQAVAAPMDCHCVVPKLQLASESPMSIAQRLEQQRRKGFAMKITGIMLTVVGTVATAVGASYLLASVAQEDSGNSNASFNVGAPTLVLGQAAVVAGITLWAVGGVRESKAKRARISLSASGIGGTF